MLNKSGMHRVAESIVEAEKKIGIDSHLVDVFSPIDGPAAQNAHDADIQVSHTHFPDAMRSRVTKPLKLVWVGHGTPEHVFDSAVEEGAKKSYGHADGWMLCNNWLRTADAIVTFWPRHQRIWKSLCDKRTIVDCVPLGVDKSFWHQLPTRGKYDGAPSLLTAENCHAIKSPRDLFIAWPWVYPKVKGHAAKLHSVYLPNDMHRWYFPLVNRNGCSYGAHLSPMTFDHDTLRNAFNSVDYYIGLVSKGDFNRVCLEAAACGTELISYTGNQYADFWLPEGDQWNIANGLAAILNGEVEPRKKDTVPDISETAEGMRKIYERLLAGD